MLKDFSNTFIVLLQPHSPSLDTNKWLSYMQQNTIPVCVQS